MAGLLAISAYPLGQVTTDALFAAQEDSRKVSVVVASSAGPTA
jgi:hypothetical protein